MPVSPSRTPLAEDRAVDGIALLIVDMISTWDFRDADRLAPGALAIAPRIAALAGRCRRAGVPVIYVNDNHGRWRSDFRQLLALSLATGAGEPISTALAPTDEDYFVLKPKHSAFYATPLDLLLRHLRASRLLLTGVAADQCVLLTAAEGVMRDYEVIVPADCIAAQTRPRNARALAHLGQVLGLRTPASTSLRLTRSRKR